MRWPSSWSVHAAGGVTVLLFLVTCQPAPELPPRCKSMQEKPTPIDDQSTTVCGPERPRPPGLRGPPPFEGCGRFGGVEPSHRAIGHRQVRPTEDGSEGYGYEFEGDDVELDVEITKRQRLSCPDVCCYVTTPGWLKH